MSTNLCWAWWQSAGAMAGKSIAKGHSMKPSGSLEKWSAVKRCHQEHHKGFWKSPEVAVDLKEGSLAILCHLVTSLISPDWVTWARMSNDQSLESFWNPSFIPENVSKNARSCDFSGQATGTVPSRHTEQVWRSNKHFKELILIKGPLSFPHHFPTPSITSLLYFAIIIYFQQQSTTMEKYTKYNKVRFTLDSLTLHENKNEKNVTQEDCWTWRSDLRHIHTFK